MEIAGDFRFEAMPLIFGTTRKSVKPFPLFRPHPLLRSGHAQTIVANYLPGAPRLSVGETLHHVPLPDGDQIVLHDDRPDNWSTGDPVALLLHGLGGSHRSAYLFRAARKLNQRGWRSFRMDYRTCGEGYGLARRSYHAGQSDDVIAALRTIESCCPGSPIGLIGYSMGGNLALKAIGEFADELPETTTRAVVVNPALDLTACCEYLTGPLQRLYDRHFAKSLISHVTKHSEFADLAPTLAEPPIMRIRDFDERFTVPQWGFETVDDYYRSASAAPHLSRITVPTLIIHSIDDPLIPPGLFSALNFSDAVSVHLTKHGGHLGFIGVGGVDADRRWMDWRVVDWITGQIDALQVAEANRPPFWRRWSGNGASTTPAISTPADVGVAAQTATEAAGR